MNPSRQRLAIALTGLALAANVAGCSPSPAPTPTPIVSQGVPDLTPPPSSVAPSSSAAPDGSPDASPSAPGGDTSLVRAYFFLGGEPGTDGLVPVLREVPGTQAIGAAAMTALLAGPTAEERADRVITTAVPSRSRLLGLTIQDGIATVDLSSDFESGGGSASVLIRLGQVVFTLTQFPTVQGVVFHIEGRPATVFSSEGIVLDRPVGRGSFNDQLSAIFVDRPAYGAALGNPARVAGSANVFEATFLITILDGSGVKIAQSQGMATCGSGCRGTFDIAVPYEIPSAGWGTLRAWDGSAKDGSPENVREYPVWLTPSG